MIVGFFNEKDEEYFTRGGISQTGLNWLRDSPAQYKYNLEHPPEETKAMIFGSAFHKAILEPEQFHDKYFIEPDVDGRTKAGKDAKIQAGIDNPGKKPLSQKDYDTLVEMQKSISGHLASMYLDGCGEREVSMFWDLHGLQCRGKLDAVSRKQHIIVDLKTCDSVDISNVERSAVNYGYHIQAAFYSDGYHLLKGERPEFYFIMVEKTAPYVVSLFKASLDFIYFGQRECERLLNLYRWCIAHNEWHGPDFDIHSAQHLVRELHPPIWATQKFSEVI